MALFSKKPSQAAYTLPKHIGIIMDGNGRWASKRGLPRTAGHRQGAKVFEKIRAYACSVGLENLTVYAFSTENWKRPREEVDTLMSLLDDYLSGILKQYDEKENVRLIFIGNTHRLSPSIQEKIALIEAKTSQCRGMTLNFAVNYGGRQELMRAARLIADDAVHGRLDPESICEEDIASRLYTRLSPEPELIIRTGAESRLSNFLLWQSAYSELYITKTLWPDFTSRDFDRAVEWFSSRGRRFGGL